MPSEMTSADSLQPELARIRHLLCAQNPSDLLEAFQTLAGDLAGNHSMTWDELSVASGIHAVEIDSPGLGRWSLGHGGLPLIDADLEHEGLSLGRFQVSGDESCEGGALVCRLSPLLIPTVSRLMAIREAQQRATVDALTGVLNRTGLEQRLSEELTRSRRNQTSLSLLMIDVDDLKALNDELGHQAGDRALCKLADTLRAATRGSDLVGRFGGDEFLVTLPETDLEAARLVAARFRRQLDQVVGAPRVSIGITEGTAEETREQLIRRADMAMYSVKQDGRDGVAAA